MNIADLFDDSALDLELDKIKQKIAKLYNERAAKHDSTMATAFVLLNNSLSIS